MSAGASHLPPRDRHSPHRLAMCNSVASDQREKQSANPRLVVFHPQISAHVHIPMRQYNGSHLSREQGKASTEEPVCRHKKSTHSCVYMRMIKHGPPISNVPTDVSRTTYNVCRAQKGRNMRGVHFTLSIKFCISRSMFPLGALPKDSLPPMDSM